MDPAHVILSAALCSVLIVLVYRRVSGSLSHNTSNLPLPPGPKGLPLVGNVRDMPQRNAYLTFTEWGKQYGDVVHVRNFGRSIVILKTAKAAVELLEKRSGNYSDRPSTMHMGGDWDFGRMQYGEPWRLHRKVFYQGFQPKAVQSYNPIQYKANRTLLRRLHDTPDEFMDIIRHYAGSVVLDAIYAYDVKPGKDYYIDLADTVMQGLSKSTEGLHLVEFLPIFKHIPMWIPGASFKRRAAEYSIASHKLRDLPFKMVQEQMAAGTAPPSFTASSLETAPEDEEIIRNSAAIAYLGGSDTTVSAIETFILAMALHPEVQRRAQAEVDRVVGQGRLPQFEDRERLPYVEHVMSETLRWYPVAPLGVPHRNIEEDIFNGYYIPAGSVIIGNVWAMMHDEEAYPDPMEFNPERFEPQEGKDAPPDPIEVVFGFGRRICPGRYLAINTTWLAIASILSTFNISKAVDKTGAELEPRVEYHSGLVIHPKPFLCRITPRSPNLLNLIQMEAERA